MNGMTAVVSEFRTQGTTEFRKPVLTLVEVSWQDPDGTLQTVPASMEDTSVGGARIRIKKPIVVGSKLRIRWRHEHFSGTARYCRPERGEYLVGIQRDATNSALPDRPAASNVTPQKSVSATAPHALPVKASPAETSPVEIPTFEVPTVKVSAIKVPTVGASTTKVSAVHVPTLETSLEIQSPPEPQEGKPNDASTIEQKAEIDPVVQIASLTSMPAGEVGHEIADSDGPRSPSSEILFGSSTWWA